MGAGSIWRNRRLVLVLVVIASGSIAAYFIVRDTRSESPVATSSPPNAVNDSLPARSAWQSPTKRELPTLPEEALPAAGAALDPEQREAVRRLREGHEGGSAGIAERDIPLPELTPEFLDRLDANLEYWRREVRKAEADLATLRGELSDARTAHDDETIAALEPLVARNDLFVRRARRYLEGMEAKLDAAGLRPRSPPAK